jgi:TetR/AcrR family transcriptional regulator, transcriptional repressor for nem operon
VAPGKVTGRAGKRERLIDAACEVIYAQGVEHSSLADIAAAAEVPLGNVYYYFRTKEDLVQAVIEAQLARARTVLAAIEATSDDPRARLRALFRTLAQQTDLIARYGCPFGSLCLELDKRAEGPGTAASLIRVPIDWAERQFRAMGRADARDLAIEVIARYQGTALLTSTLRDPALMTREAARVADWLDALA